MRALLLALVVLASATDRAHSRIAACGDGTYVVEDGAIFPSDTALTANGVVIGNKKLALGSVCPAVHLVRTHGKHGDRIAARWSRCTGIKGKVAFKGSLDARCTTLHGSVIARKSNLKRALTAAVPPTGSLHGQVRLRSAIDVPPGARAGVLAMKTTLEAEGNTVADDGSTITSVMVGARGWLVRVGDAETYTAEDGTFTITVPTNPPTVGTIYHPIRSCRGGRGLRARPLPGPCRQRGRADRSGAAQRRRLRHEPRPGDRSPGVPRRADGRRGPRRVGRAQSGRVARVYPRAARLVSGAGRNELQGSGRGDRRRDHH